MDWFDVIKNVEIDETTLNAREFAEENCCANIWKSIAQEQPRVFDSLQKSNLWRKRKTTVGCRMLVDWLRRGDTPFFNAHGWNFPPSVSRGHISSAKDATELIYNQKKGWLQDFVDCRNLKDGGNRPQLEMY